MDPIVTTDIQELLSRYRETHEETNIAVGIRPSGTIHLGNMSVIALAGYLAREIGPQNSQVNLTICDTDIPHIHDWKMISQRHVRYFVDLPDKSECHPNLLAHASEKIGSFVSDLEALLGVKYNIANLSEVQRQEGFRRGLKRVVEDPNIMRFLNKRFEKGVLVYPICPECHTSNPVPSGYSGGILETTCSNPDCDVKYYSMNILDTSSDLAVHYFIDPLRDRCAEPRSKIHVFGGDYRTRRRNEDVSKVDKILRVMNIAGEGDIPDIAIGPVFYAKEGGPMSKRKDNGVSLDTLSHSLGSEYTSRILSLVIQLAEQGYKNVDYQMAQDFLFGNLTCSL